MEQGWVYVLVNSSLPGMVKIGCTTRSTAERAVEISAATGVPTPFVVAFDQAFEDCEEAERLIHAELDRRGSRVAPNREFFRGAPSDIIRTIIELAEHDQPAPRMALHVCADRLCQAGDKALFGEGDTLQDTGEALRLYKLAGARGSLSAFERIGQIYNATYLASRDRQRRRRALTALKEGARRGNYYCYCELAVLFAAEHHVSNFIKVWDLFFARRLIAPVEELETDPGRFPVACGRYIVQSLELSRQPAHRSELACAGDSIMAALMAQLAAARGNAAACQRLTAALRWAYETLADPAPANRREPRRMDLSPLPSWVCDQGVVIT